MRILIADDERSFAIALADMVRWCGHQIVGVVGSGLEAIHAYTLHKPDLVLMDYRMPKLNGGTASRHILAKDPAARIVLLSAWSPSDGADESGAMFFLPKPVELDRLNATLLTIAQSLPPSDLTPSSSDLPASNFDLPIPSFQSIPIPQEIISPGENFPIPAPAAEQMTSEVCAVKGKKVDRPRRNSPRNRAKRVG